MRVGDGSGTCLPTGGLMRAMTRDVRAVATYLMTCGSSNMIGLYYIPLTLIAYEIGSGMTIEGASKALQSLAELGFAFYDEASELVFVPHMAREQIGETLRAGDRQRLGVLALLKVRSFGAKHWNKPLRWNRAARAAGKRARVFCGSMCDVFEHRTGPAGKVLEEQRERLWELIASTEDLDWLLLTKRPQNIGTRVAVPWSGAGPANVWLGCTVEVRAALPRIDVLRRIPACVRFVSCEPLLEDLGAVDLTGIHLVIVGGESGPKARPMDQAWANSRRPAVGVAAVHPPAPLAR